ncbi:MAG: glycosyltransferase family 8 protein [Alkalibacterium gilvum]|uniref:Lipopolysaccharide biosynthesis protein, LPS:glycosyltransferase n=1 Tax=Alkalibacterium gilvum TaxID=1130080 RepID=A0A1H6SSW1_9LACT|nr:MULTISPECIES: glycosyltransferase family 8 protein [Alkalibacterium]MDN6293894.1 glycosyltransferase family 8 protein [Alkalibacterium sp.]MDN6295861.1 glycosyltransferase family 8 protein [Alkalibacterium sp.]MDN6729155.1 glycosyltransferase family 8 protein [Alkalibacterium sp.]SEI69986.1 Lipopolysaccharide biosynthesis protein, LPS:glycosyltransferase [Alkalibacterium gilvum]HAJ70039.1 glycosyltransferase family 8 protein [Alkalibacterium sp.]
MINVLFSLDENYIYPLKVLIHSLIENHPNESFRMYLLHAGIKSETLKELETNLKREGNHELIDIYCKDFFKESDELAITRYYALEMYLWMFAPSILPSDIDRILYLDPDIINVGDIRSLYNQSFEGHSFIATNYKYKTKWVQPFNNLRLRNFESENYFNSGVVMMNMKKLRQVADPDQLVEAIRENKSILILPDQDIFNMLYHNDIKEEDWRIYNMNPKVYEKLKVIFPNRYNFQMIDDKVVFIHYLGKNKPWDKREKYKYALGKYYFEAERKTYSETDYANKGNKE